MIGIKENVYFHAADADWLLEIAKAFMRHVVPNVLPIVIIIGFSVSIGGVILEYWLLWASSDLVCLPGLLIGEVCSAGKGRQYMEIAPRLASLARSVP